MKKSEKDALKNAFNIPEPKHKNTFVSSYNEMLKKNERKFNIPAFFRWTSTAVFAALIIGVWGSLSKNAGFPDEYTKDKPSIITETTTMPINTTVKSNDITKTVTSSMPLNTATSAESRTTTSETSAASEKTRKTTINTSTSSLSSSAITTKPQTKSTAKVTEITAAEPENTATAEITQTTAVTDVSITKTTVRTTNHNTIKTTVTSLTTTVKTTALKTTTATTENNAFSPDPTTPTTHNDELLVVPSVVPSTTRTTARSDETNCTTFSKTPSVDVPPSGTNYTVTPSANYSKSENIIDINNIFENNTSSEPNDNILNPYDLINKSGYIVSGRIDEIIYTEVNGMPCTQENITVYKVYKGGRLFPMDRISVYMKGGYMPVKDFTSIHGIDNEYPDNYSVYDSGGNNGTQNVGDVFLFFISDGTSSMPDGAFMLTSYNDTSVFSSEDNKYISLGNENIIFNINDLLNN